MNYNQNRYTGSPKKKILLRCLIVLASLATVAALTLAYGNYLKSKAEKSAVGSYSGAGRSISADDSSNEDDLPSTFSKSESVKSAALDDAAFADVDKLSEHVAGLCESGSTGITVVLLDSEGYLTYASDAVAQYTHQRASSLTSEGLLTTLTQKAKSLSMRTTAVIFTSEDFAKDGISSDIEALVCADAAACGFQEVVAVMPVTSAGINSDTSASIVSYISRLAGVKSTALLGIAFGDDLYRTPSLAPQIELFASGADFLAIDLTYRFSDAESAKTRIAGTVDEIAGSFTVYGLRAVFEGSDAAIAAAEAEALAENGFSNYMFTSMQPITDDTPVTDALPADTDAPVDPGTDGQDYPAYDTEQVTEDAAGSETSDGTEA